MYVLQYHNSHNNHNYHNNHNTHNNHNNHNNHYACRYFNTFTGERTWHKPPEVDLFGVEPQRPHKATKWVEEWDTTAGAYFYYNSRTGEYV